MPSYDKWFNGITLSRKIQNGFDDMQNCDVHSDLGSLLCQKKLAENSSGLVDRPCYMAVVPSGDSYFFSKTDGKIWRRTQAGGWNAIRVNSNGAHKGAAYYRGKLYYTTNGHLGVFDLVNTWNDNYQVLTTGVAHPLFQFDLILYIGNGNNVAQLDDADVFSSSALDLQTEQKISALINLGDDLLTLSNPGNYLNDSLITRWNTYSDSWSINDQIKETDVYAFLDADNYVYAIAKSGNVYLYNGSVLEPFSFIRDAATTTGHQLTTNFKGRPLIANGGEIFSLHRKNRNMPFALVGEYTCSAGENATIHSIAANGETLLVSWEYNGTYGVDALSSEYATAEVVTPRFRKNGVVKVFYDNLNGGSILIYSRRDGETNWSGHTVINDTEDFRMVRTVDDIIVPAGGQAKIYIVPSVSSPTTTPIIDGISVEAL